MTLDEAREHIRDEAKAMGMSFHIDTPYQEYMLDDEYVFSMSNAAAKQARLDLAVSIVTDAGEDPYAIALEAMPT